MTNSEYVLLVEDNKKDELLAKRAFAKGSVNCRVEVVRDGQEALDYFIQLNESEDPLPKLVLLDLNLPKITGLEVLRNIRKSNITKLLPVVILSSSDDLNDISNSYENGANGYVCKPVIYSDYADTIKKLWDYWLSINKSVLSQ